MLAHVVDAEERRAALEGGHGGSDARGRRAGRGVRVAEQAAEGALARDADHEGAARARQLGQAADERQVVLHRLAEAEAGIEADPLLRDSLPDGEGEALLEERGHLGYHVVVVRIRLHRPRLALHVHEAEICAGAGDDARELRIAAERRDVVHQHDAELERAARDAGLRRVDRDRNAGEILEHRDDAAQLLVEAHRGRAGASRLAAHVDERRAVRGELPRPRDGGSAREGLTAVGEAVGRHVDDPDHSGPGKRFLERDHAGIVECAGGRVDERPPASTLPVAAAAPPGGRLVANALYRTVSDIASKLALAVLYIVMARQLGTGGFGIFSFAFSLAVLVTTLANFGEDKLLVRSVSRDPRALNRTFADTIALQGSIGLGALAIAEAVLPLTGVAETTRVVLGLVGLAVVLDVVTSTHLAVFQARERMALIPAVIVPQRLGVAVVGTYALYRGVGVEGIAAIYLVGSLLALPLAVLLLRGEVARPPFRLALRRWPPLLVASLPIGVATAFATILFRVDMVMLRAYRSAQDVGAYAGAYRLFEMTLFLCAGVGASALPAFSRLKASQRPELDALLRRTLVLVCVPSIPLAILAATIPGTLLHAAYGRGYGSAADALRLLAPAIVLYPISFMCGYMLVAQGRVRPLVTVYGIVAVENVAANLVLIRGCHCAARRSGRRSRRRSPRSGWASRAAEVREKG